MTQFGTLYQEVQGHIGRASSSDSLAVTISKRGINAAMFAACLLFEPPESRVNGDLTALHTQDYVALSGLTRVQRVEEVYNSTGACRVYPLPYNMRNVLWLPTSGDIQFYSLYGNVLYYNPTPVASQTLNVYYLQYPALLSGDSDTFPFPTLEHYALSFATEFAWASLEEPESQAVWEKVSEKMQLPEAMAAKIRLMYQEQYSTEEK